jgi:hypothetical protein
MANLSPTAEPVAPPRGVPALTLLAEGFREVRARWPWALALWAASAAWSFAPRLIRAARGATHVTWSPADFAQLGLSAVLGAILAALALRLFLVRGRGWWHVDRGFAVCVGLLALAGLGNSAVAALSLGGLKDLTPGGLGYLELRMGAVFIPQAVLAWIYVRLMLWPIGALVAADAAMTPGRSWALMRGQVAGFVVAAIVLSLPLILVTPLYAAAGVLTHHGQVGGLTWLRIATAVFSPAAHLMQHAMAAVIWRAKTGHPHSAAS